MPKIVSEIAEVFIYRKYNDGIKYLLLKRSASEVYPGIWSIAGGRIDDGEKAYETGIREMFEETGLTSKYFYKVDKIDCFYDIKNDVIQLTPIFLAEANEGEVILSEEHSEYRWMNFEEAYENIFWIDWKNNIKLINEILNDDKLFGTLEKII